MKWWKFFWRKSSIEKELDSEIRFHRDSVIQEKIAAGLSPEEARRLTMLEFGGAEQVKEECRWVHRILTIENTLTNLKSAARFIRKSPAFSATVIATLALGIGANSAVFSAIDAILLRPLPFPNPAEVVVLHQYNRAWKNPITPIAPVRLEEWNKYMSQKDSADDYHRLFEIGRNWIDKNLFNGEYYIQLIQGHSPAQIAAGLRVGMGTEDTEHPQYQFGSGCLVDQMVGQYLAESAGLATCSPLSTFALPYVPLQI
jgi:hypothetical protein